jgi:uridine kinase
MDRDFVKLEELEKNIKGMNNPGYVAECEGSYKKFIKSAAAKIIDGNIRVVYLCGQSSSGKTTSSLRLKNYLSRLGKTAHLIELDDFFLPKEKLRLNKAGAMDFESVFALDLEAVYKLQKDIKAGLEVNLPNFDFKSGEYSYSQGFEVKKDDVLILEGIHSFNNRITKTFGNEKSLKIFITVNTEIDLGDTFLHANDLRFIRRLVRDYRHRSASPDYTVRLWKSVRAGEKRYSEKYRQSAGIFRNSFLNYEPYLFKNDALRLIEEGIAASRDNVYLKIIRNKLSRLSDAGNIEVPEMSILNEFI